MNSRSIDASSIRADNMRASPSYFEHILGDVSRLEQLRGARTLGKRVTHKGSRVRIPPSPLKNALISQSVFIFFPSVVDAARILLISEKIPTSLWEFLFFMELVSVSLPHHSPRDPHI